MSYYVGSRRSLDRIFAELKRRGVRVFGPMKRDGSIVYGELKGTEDLPLAKGGISSITHHSVKELVHPPNQLFLLTDPDYSSRIHEENLDPWALFGIRSCDLASISVMDSLLSEDPFYGRRRRGLTWVIVEECLEPGIFCFCGTMGTGPSPRENFDISYASIGRDCLIFRAGSEKGRQVLSSIQLKEADESIDEVKIYKQRIEASIESMRKRFRESSDGFKDALEKSIGDIGLWRRLSEGCVGCSNCNMVCPTCSCTEFIDEAMMDGRAERGRVWIGCLSPVYGQVAGAHFRKEQYMRYRHFVLHKFLFSQKRQGINACVGCGRCIAFCPMGLDLRSNIQEVLKSYGGK
ncbi:MAG: 4Fe-4S dicluster domain-containing protein [Fervidicoccaceae archaeon]|jgi:ferredoxin